MALGLLGKHATLSSEAETISLAVFSSRERLAAPPSPDRSAEPAAEPGANWAELARSLHSHYGMMPSAYTGDET